MRVAIVAHYDPDNIWDANFIELLRITVGVVGRIIVVTTSEGIGDLPPDLANAELIRRPNIGYDFYSYRVGAHIALSNSDLVSGIFFLNSSFLLLDRNAFARLLLEMVGDGRESSVRGVTESSQIAYHLQSYLIYFDLHRLPKDWLLHFFSRVEPVNDKFEVVVRYEIGLSQALMNSGIEVEALYKPSFKHLVIGVKKILISRWQEAGLSSIFNTKICRLWKEINWTHFAADALALQFGIVKTEFLRTNPHGLPHGPIWATCNIKLCESVEQSLSRTRHNYIAGGSGLTELTKSRDPMGIIKEIITVPQYQQIGARVAVVLHLFYVDLLEEIIQEVTHILEPYDLYITTPFEADIPKIINEMCRREQSLTIVLTKNRGRDVGPFISLYRTGRLDKYDAVLKLHSKRSKYSEKGDFWRRELIEPLCGGALAVMRSLELIRLKHCGIVGPARYFLTNFSFWGANRLLLRKILIQCGIAINPDGPELAFFAGTMFWFSPAAFKDIYGWNTESMIFEAENGKQDGTLAHAWERAFSLLAKNQGFKVSAVELKGLDLFTKDNIENKVPVLTLK